MTSTFHGLETARRSLFTQSASLQTMGHNIANANTEGYTRQRVNTSATRPLEAPGMQRSNTPGQLGTGVQVDSIKRVRDNYLDVQYRRENQRLGSLGVQDATLRSIESILNEPSSNGLQAVMDKFWSSLEVLNRDPQLLSARIDVVGASVNFVDTLHHIDESLTNLEDDINSSFSIKTGEANTIIQNIADLNELIRRTEGLGNNANDYRDKRDLLVDQLSTLVDVQAVEGVNGNFTIMSAGVQVVNNGTATLLTAATAQGATEGELAGYQASLGETTKIRDQLNAMVNTLVTGTVTITLPNGYTAKNAIVAKSDATLSDGTVIPAGVVIPAGSKITSSVDIEVDGFNGIHELGYGFTTPANNGVPFFTTTSGSAFDISNIQVNPDIRNNTDNIGSSASYDTVTNTTIKGNSDIAHAMSGLRDKVLSYSTALTNLSQGTTDDYFRAMVGDLGTRSSNVGRNLSNQQDMVDSFTIRKQEVSGVSLDEEMANMIQFQHAYNAAARNMTAIDEMLDRIINQMGIVGR